jgi:two-component system response regulator LytT
MKIMIIEDEKVTARDLAQTILQLFPQAQILTILTSVKESIYYFLDGSKADLVFSDIQLGDGLSFEIFSKVDIKVPVIFCTAFDEWNRLYSFDPGAVLVYQKDRILPIAIGNIAFFYLKNGVVNLTTFEKKNYLINKSMEELGSLTEPLFFRANRQFLINRKAVLDAFSYLSRKLLVTVCVPTEESITISKEKMPQFLNWLQQS